MDFKDTVFLRWEYLNTGDRNSSSSDVETQAFISIDVYLTFCDVSTNHHTRIFFVKRSLALSTTATALG
jgi:hypothetical protein